ncbi:GTPase [Deinococcus sp. 12RED42]|uniref:GTPase n=1 Tax=Deinococcus sp. 12RED42 TaxID=2745872 RepID=UPI001E2C59D3|nr:GTPase [Deinococcus sp. 12RED42]MCD0164721.1 50S ribosome-binding GTPase [Deinococcus sp. 12RED42]
MDIHQEARNLRKELEEMDNTTIRVAFFGQPGAGKSSLINAVLGRDEAEVSVRTDTTVAAARYSTPSVPGVELYDLPGYGTSHFPKESYFEKFKIDEFDLYVCVTSGKLMQADTEFFRYLTSHNRQCIFVFNKHDQLWQVGLTARELENQKTRDIQRQVGQAVDVIYTSCRPDANRQLKGIDDLMGAIRKRLEDAKGDRWDRSVKAWSLEALERKREASKRRVALASAVAAANGAFNIVPGVDVALNMTIVNSMRAEIRRSFGLNDSDTRDFDGKNGPLSEDGLASLIKSMAENGATHLPKIVPLRFVPIFGNLVNGALAFMACMRAGNYYVDVCYNIAAERLAQQLKR